MNEMGGVSSTQRAALEPLIGSAGVYQPSYLSGDAPEDSFSSSTRGAGQGNRFIFFGLEFVAAAAALGVGAYLFRDKIGKFASSMCPNFVKSGFNSVKSWFGFGAKAAEKGTEKASSAVANSAVQTESKITTALVPTSPAANSSSRALIPYKPGGGGANLSPPRTPGPGDIIDAEFTVKTIPVLPAPKPLLALPAP